MVVESTEIERLATSWESVERELRDAGYEREAGIVAVCRESLAGQLDREGGSRVRVLLRVWADDAAVLKTYGFQSAAESLWRCRDALQATLASSAEAEPPAGSERGSRPPPVPPPGAPRHSPGANGDGPSGSAPPRWPDRRTR